MQDIASTIDINPKHSVTPLHGIPADAQGKNANGMHDNSRTSFNEDFQQGVEVQDVAADIADVLCEGTCAKSRRTDVDCCYRESARLHECCDNRCAEESASSCDEDGDLLHCWCRCRCWK